MNILIRKLFLIKDRPDLGLIIVNIGWLFADRIVRMGVGLIVSIWVARYLGARQFGVLNYATAFVALFSSLGNLGLDDVIICSIVREPESKQKILGTTFFLKLLGGLSCLFLAFLSIFVLRHDDKLTIWLVVIFGSAGIFQSFDTIDLWFQSQVQSKYTVIAKNTAFIVSTFLKIYLIIIQAPLIPFACAGLAEISLSSLFLIYLYKIKEGSISMWQWSFSLANTILRQSWPLILSGVTAMIYMRIDQIMLGQMVGDRAVGIYSAASRISEVWYFIPIALTSSFSPSIYVAKEKSESLYYKRITKLLRLLVFLSIVIALPLSFLSNQIIMILYGNSYAEAGQILAIHIWSSIFVFMGVGISSWFVAEELTYFSFKITLTGAILNIFLNLFLIPSYGGVGAAMATVITQLFASFLGNAVHPKTRKIFKLQIKSLILFGYDK
jgi:polysaccharide transporter, PST family